MCLWLLLETLSWLLFESSKFYFWQLHVKIWQLVYIAHMVGNVMCAQFIYIYIGVPFSCLTLGGGGSLPLILMHTHVLMTYLSRGYLACKKYENVFFPSKRKCLYFNTSYRYL